MEGTAPPDVELYDIAADPREQQDVAAEHPAEVEKILRRLDQYRSEAVPPLKGARNSAPPGFVVPEVWGPLEPR